MPSTRGKRKIGTPTGYTPGKPAQKKITESESTSRKSLFNDATDTVSIMNLVVDFDFCTCMLITHK